MLLSNQMLGKNINHHLIDTAKSLAKIRTFLSILYKLFYMEYDNVSSTAHRIKISNNFMTIRGNLLINTACQRTLFARRIT